MNAPIARTRAPLSKAMLVIEYLAEKSIKEVGVRNLARHLNISPAAAQGLIALMREAGFIERSDGDNATYVFSRRLLKVARDIAETSSYAGLAFETLSELAKASNETAVLGEYDRRSNQLIFTQLVESHHAVRVVPRMHEWMTIDRAASGLAVLAFLPAHEQERILSKATVEIEYRRSPWTKSSELMAALAAAKRSGYSMTISQRALGAVGIFSPVFVMGKVIGSIGLDVPEQRFQRSQLPHFGKLVVNAARALEERISGEVALAESIEEIPAAAAGGS